MFDYCVMIVECFDVLGVVFVVKFLMGVFVMGDCWFKGRMNCFWNLNFGLSGLFVGLVCVMVVGFVGFFIGMEMLGSIVLLSWCCGMIGFWLIFGWVSCYGCMVFFWFMDKIGLIICSVEDCVYIFVVIYGIDGSDLIVVDWMFNWFY